MSSRAHSPEFRAMFAEEAGSRLPALEAAARACADGDEDPAHIDVMHREAHTLKGGAAVVGFEEIAELLLGLERRLSAQRASGAPAPPEAGTDALEVAGRVRSMIETAMAEG